MPETIQAGKMSLVARRNSLSRLFALTVSLILCGAALGCDDPKPPLTPVSPTPVAPTPPAPPTATTPTPARVTLAPSTVPGGTDGTATITLSAASPAAGTIVTLTSSNSAVVVPATVTVAAGATSADVTFSTRDVIEQTRATITATTGNASAAAELLVTPVPRQAAGFRIEPDRLVGSATATGRVSLAQFAAAQGAITTAAIGDVILTLTSSHPAVIVPASITVPAGQTEATFPITTTRVTRDVNVILTVTSGNQTRTTSLFVMSGPPTLISVSPSDGYTTGGTAITLSGTRLSGATAVTVGGGAASKVVVVNETTVTAETPAHAGGRFGISVTTPDGVATLDDAFTYFEPQGPPPTSGPAPPSPPTLTAIAPSSGVILGGTVVTLTGTNLTGATSVTFDAAAATTFTVVNATTITATAPAHAIGAVAIGVTTPGGTATLPAAYAYVSGSTLTAVSANSGSASGGRGVTLTGTGLTGATSVTFGGVAATSVNVVNSTTVTAVTPARAAGVTDVAISTPAGGATLTNGFTYLATAVGQPAHGGIIAALNGGQNNLIAASADNSTAIEWGGLGTSVAAAQSTSDGGSNTAAIVAGLGGIPSSYAAGVCSVYEVDSQGNTPCQAGNACYNDWFLPAGNNLTATGQLNALFTNRAAIGGFAAGNYWSSTQTVANPTIRAHGQSFVSGADSMLVKLNLYRVRCVRAFTP